MAERRAESRGRIKLIETSANQIAEQMRTDPEYARAAVKKFGEKVLRERINVDQIAAVALEDLQVDDAQAPQTPQTEVPPISEDWLNVFENEASQMSTDQMQRLFGRILAGEIRRPSSYSIKTVKLMAQLDNRAAALFKMLCSMSMSIRMPNYPNVIVDARVVSLGGNAGSNSLQPHGLAFDALNILQEYGLIIADYNSYMNYVASIARGGQVSFPLTFQKAWWGFLPKTGGDVQRQNFNVHGVGFSQCGKEMLSIVDIDPTPAYTEALKRFFDGQDMTMTPVMTATPVG
jgi:Protein of unknown function (DUF2806)